MKKFISMLTMIALVSTMFTISAFADEKPTLNFEVTAYTDYDELTGHNDYLEEAEEIPEGYTAYVIDYNLTNLDLSNSGSQTSTTGTVITDFTLYLKTTSAELDLIDSIVTYANYSADPDQKGYEWDSYYYTAVLSRTKGVFPKKTQDGSDVFASTVVMIPSDKAVTLIPMNDVFNNGAVTFTNSVNVATFNAGTLTAGSQAAYKLSNGTLVSSVDKIVLGTPAPASNVQATKGDDGIITVTGDSALAGKDILVHDAALPQGASLSEASRFVVRQISTDKTQNYNIFEALNAEGIGSIGTKIIKFGIVSNSDLDATDFEFSFTGINQ